MVKSLATIVLILHKQTEISGTRYDALVFCPCTSPEDFCMRIYYRHIHKTKLEPSPNGLRFWNGMILN